MASDRHYDYLRAHRPDLLRACVEVGLCVTCAPLAMDQARAAKAESRAVEIVANLLREHKVGSEMPSVTIARALDTARLAGRAEALEHAATEAMMDHRHLDADGDYSGCVVCDIARDIRALGDADATTARLVAAAMEPK